RYFGLQPHQLSWAETATLAVLPNAPGLIHPGKNRSQLMDKRNRLLYKLFKNNYMDSTTYHLSLLEELPEKPFHLPESAPHLLQYQFKKNKGARIRSTVDGNLQTSVNAIVDKHYRTLRQNQ